MPYPFGCFHILEFSLMTKNWILGRKVPPFGCFHILEFSLMTKNWILGRKVPRITQNGFWVRLQSPSNPPLPPICCKMSPESVLALHPINSTGRGQMVHTGRGWTVPSLIESERGPRERVCAHKLTKSACPLLSLHCCCCAKPSSLSSAVDCLPQHSLAQCFFHLTSQDPQFPSWRHRSREVLWKLH